MTVSVDKQPGMKKAIRNAALLGLLALGFYVAIFLLVKWRHP